MQAIYIIKTGSTFGHISQALGDFEHWIERGLLPPHLLPAERPNIRVVDATKAQPGDDLHYPDAGQCAGVIITGSHAMATEHTTWMQTLSQWLLHVCHSGVPVLGICFGHQLLADVLGGLIGTHPAGVELGTVPIALQANVQQDPLWHDMPACFEAHTVHYQTVRKLPAQAQALAGNSHEPHHAFRWRHNVWGVQFHPEFSQAAMQAYIDHIHRELQAHGLDTDNVRSRSVVSRPTPDAAHLLHNFLHHVQSPAQRMRAQHLAMTSQALAA